MRYLYCKILKPFDVEILNLTAISFLSAFSLSTILFLSVTHKRPAIRFDRRGGKGRGSLESFGGLCAHNRLQGQSHTLTRAKNIARAVKLESTPEPNSIGFGTRSHFSLSHIPPSPYYKAAGLPGPKK